jgi:hypothetical protein
VASRVETGGITGVHPYGRRVFFVRNNGGFVLGGEGVGDVRAQTLANPATWDSANVVTAIAKYPYEHRISFSGSTAFLPRDLDGSSVHRLTYNSTTFRPNPATTLHSFDLGGDSHTIHVVGDRVYFHFAQAGGLVFRTR